MGMLDKREKSRMNSAEVMKHDWLAGNGSSSGHQDNKDGGDGSKDEGDQSSTILREDAANVGIQERRQELINRLNKEHDVTNKKKESKQTNNKFSQASLKLHDKQGGTMTYEW